MQSRVSFKTTYTCMIHLVHFTNSRTEGTCLAAFLHEPQLHDLTLDTNYSCMIHSCAICSHTIHSYMILLRISNHLIPCASGEQTETTCNGLFQHLLKFQMNLTYYQAESRQETPLRFPQLISRNSYQSWIEFGQDETYLHPFLLQVQESTVGEVLPPERTLILTFDILVQENEVR
jgi:hypothetical protein